MRADRPSFTAAAVAFGRAVGLGGRRDTVARALVPAPFAQVLGLIDRAEIPEIVARVGTAGLVDHASLRMAAIDEAANEALRDGIDQVAILGAGLDSRAWRMDAMAKAVVFEIDHPATQAYKRERVSDLAPLAREARFVPVDFAIESIAGALPRVGHDPHRATVWIWEGVTMYLPPEAIAKTLREIRAMSAPGSRLLVSYVTKEAIELPVVSHVVRVAFRVFGEPLLGAMSESEAHALLGESGFTIVTDTTSNDWAARWGGSSTLAWAFSGEHLAVARV